MEPTTDKVLYFCMGDNMDTLAELITKENPNAKVFSQAFVTTHKSDPKDDDWENLDEFRRIKRMKNYYLKQITEQGKNLIVVTIPNLDPLQCEYLKEQADICEFKVIVIDCKEYQPKQPLPVPGNNVATDSSKKKVWWHGTIFDRREKQNTEVAQTSVTN